MKLDDRFKEIESINFAIRITILSGFKILLLTLERDETLKEFIGEIEGSSEKQDRVLNRLLELLPANDHPGYMHPYDPALVAYLYTLDRVNASLAHQAAEQLAQNPELFWARRLANHILQTPVSHPAK